MKMSQIFAERKLEILKIFGKKGSLGKGNVGESALDLFWHLSALKNFNLSQMGRFRIWDNYTR